MRILKSMCLVIFAVFINGAAYSCEIAKFFNYPTESSKYIPGSYSERVFLASGGDHLGEDEELAEGYKIRAIANGKIVWYSLASGYGNLVVVIEHDLGGEFEFINGNGEIVRTSKLLSIYGHLRKTPLFNGTNGLTWKVGDCVKIGDVIGYIERDDSNGDGAEHLHLGIRLSDKSTAELRDDAWFRGYDKGSGQKRDFTSAFSVIRKLGVVGYYSDGFHNDGTSQAFVNSFNRLSPKIGWPSDNGGGVYVHTWVSSHDSRYKTDVQDYQGGDQSMLILNVLSSPYQANWVKGGFCYLYRISDGPFSFGIAYTEEITHNYATSPISTAK